MKYGVLAFICCISMVHCVRVRDQSYRDLYQQEPQYAPVQYKKIKEKKPEQDFSKIPGTPGVDYPIYHEVPQTNFDCAKVPAVPGQYANAETGCQAYHVCHEDGRGGKEGSKFLCTNGTIYNQKEFTCDWWYNVKCEEAEGLYRLNADPEHNPYVPKVKKIDDEVHAANAEYEKYSHQPQYSQY
ncbi:unnamed protein product [Diamesa serratosioi]